MTVDPLKNLFIITILHPQTHVSFVKKPPQVTNRKTHIKITVPTNLFRILNVKKSHAETHITLECRVNYSSRIQCNVRSMSD